MHFKHSLFLAMLRLQLKQSKMTGTAWQKLLLSHSIQQRTIFGKAKIRRFGAEKLSAAREIQTVLRKQLHPSTLS